VAARDNDINAYVARQAATVGRAAFDEPQNALPASPIGKLKDAFGPCLGVLDEYQADSYSQHAGAVVFAKDGRSVLHARGDGAILRFALPSGAVLWRQPRSGSGGSRIFAIAISPDGKRFVVSPADGAVRMHDVETGDVLWHGHGAQAGKPWVLHFSPDGKRLVGSGSNRDVAILSADDGSVIKLLKPADSSTVFGSAWSPQGDFIATADNSCHVRIWDASTFRLLHERRNHRRDINGLSISTDGKRVASAGEDSKLVLWSPFVKNAEPLTIEGHRDFLWSVAFSPEGKRIASSGNDRTIRIWDNETGAELATFEHPDTFAFRIAWSPDGALLASTHPCKLRLWDTRETLRQITVAPRLLRLGPLSTDLAILPSALSSLLRIERSAPLSLLRELLSFTSGRGAVYEGQTVLRTRHIDAMISLRWPAEARVAMVLFLLRKFEDTSFAPPEGVTAAELRIQLLEALAGGPMAEKAPPFPTAFLLNAVFDVDERFLTLLASLGPAACAQDPTLPITLFARLDEIAPHITVDRRLLDLRIPTNSLGAAEAKGPWLEPSGFSSVGTITTLVPSQWALPDDVRRYRAATGGLLYRARMGREPPRLRPLVIVLDVSPASFGPVEAMLRSAAHALASTLLEAEIPAYFIAAGGENNTHAIVRRADLFEVLTARSTAPIMLEKTFLLAQTLLASLPEGGPFPPAVVVLSHPALGAEDDPTLPAPTELLGLFVHYPGHPAEPAIRKRLRRCVTLGPDDDSRLAKALGEVLA